jgi:hypothetical protein
MRSYLKNKLGMVKHACKPNTWEAEVGDSKSKAYPDKSARPYLKTNERKKGEAQCSVASVGP